MAFAKHGGSADKLDVVKISVKCGWYFGAVKQNQSRITRKHKHLFISFDQRMSTYSPFFKRNNLKCRQYLFLENILFDIQMTF